MNKKAISLCLAIIFLFSFGIHRVWSEERTVSYFLVAADTPVPVIDELESNNIAYVQYQPGKSLTGRDGMFPSLQAYDIVFMCEGTYMVQTACFASLSEAQNYVKIIGAGMNKTVITGSSDNFSAAFDICGTAQNPVTGVQISGLQAAGFAWGVRMRNAEDIYLCENRFTKNSFAGIVMEPAQNCIVSDNEISYNGRSDGYGVMFMYGSTGSTGHNNLYYNNGSKNIIEFTNRGAQGAGINNNVQMTMYRDEQLEIGAPQTVRIEAENGILSGNADLRFDTSSFSSFSGPGYVDLYGGQITLMPFIKTAGYYEIHVGVGKTDNNNKQDYLKVNNGATYYITPPRDIVGNVFTRNLAGNLHFENGYYLSKRPAQGFFLEEGSNTVVISANWGYASYDYIELIPIGVLSDTFSSSLHLNREDWVITGIEPGMTMQQLMNKLHLTAGYPLLERKTNGGGYESVLPGDKVTTGMVLTVWDGSYQKDRFSTVIYGDVTEDGNVDLTDMVTIKKNILGEQNGISEKAADVNRDNTVNAQDIVTLKRHVLGIQKIWS